MYYEWIIFGFFFIFFATALGSAATYLSKKEPSVRAQTFCMGFASGIMLAASVWSLLLPSIDQAARYLPQAAFLPSAIGVAVGGLAISALGRYAKSGEEKLFFAMTLHNIPEGLAVGFAFGAATTPQAYASALMLAIGIGFQNFPEGAAVALPMKKRYGNKKAFSLGVVSGIVEPIFAIFGFLLAGKILFLQPWLLAFSAGAMIFVVLEELIPSIDCSQRTLGVWSALVGFILMMVLDVALG